MSYTCLENVKTIKFTWSTNTKILMKVLYSLRKLKILSGGHPGTKPLKSPLAPHVD